MKQLNGVQTGFMVALVAVLVSSISLEAGAAGKGNGASSMESSQVVNINTATAGELALLPGIGPSKAQAIVKYREKREFKKVQDLGRVTGIGRKTINKLKPYLAVTGATTLKKTAAKSK